MEKLLLSKRALYRAIIVVYFLSAALVHAGGKTGELEGAKVKDPQQIEVDINCVTPVLRDENLVKDIHLHIMRSYVTTKRINDLTGWACPQGLKYPMTLKAGSVNLMPVDDANKSITTDSWTIGDKALDSKQGYPAPYPFSYGWECEPNFEGLHGYGTALHGVTDRQIEVDFPGYIAFRKGTDKTPDILLIVLRGSQGESWQGKEQTSVVGKVLKEFNSASWMTNFALAPISMEEFFNKSEKVKKIGITSTVKNTVKSVTSSNKESQDYGDMLLHGGFAYKAMSYRVSMIKSITNMLKRVYLSEKGYTRDALLSREEMVIKDGDSARGQLTKSLQGLPDALTQLSDVVNTLGLECLKNLNIIVTGHSQGGALAQLTFLDVVVNVLPKLFPEKTNKEDGIFDNSIHGNCTLYSVSGAKVAYTQGTVDFFNDTCGLYNMVRHNSFMDTVPNTPPQGKDIGNLWLDGTTAMIVKSKELNGFISKKTKWEATEIEEFIHPFVKIQRAYEWQGDSAIDLGNDAGIFIAAAHYGAPFNIDKDDNFCPLLPSTDLVEGLRRGLTAPSEIGKDNFVYAKGLALAGDWATVLDRDIFGLDNEETRKKGLAVLGEILGYNNVKYAKDNPSHITLITETVMYQYILPGKHDQNKMLEEIYKLGKEIVDKSVFILPERGSGKRTQYSDSNTTHEVLSILRNKQNSFVDRKSFFEPYIHIRGTSLEWFGQLKLNRFSQIIDGKNQGGFVMLSSEEKTEGNPSLYLFYLFSGSFDKEVSTSNKTLGQLFIDQVNRVVDDKNKTKEVYISLPRSARSSNVFSALMGKKSHTTQKALDELGKLILSSDNVMIVTRGEGEFTSESSDSSEEGPGERQDVLYGKTTVATLTRSKSKITIAIEAGGSTEGNRKKYKAAILKSVGKTLPKEMIIDCQKVEGNYYRFLLGQSLFEEW